jgi:hypothetical protein
MEWIWHKSYLIEKPILSRFIDPFEFQVSKGNTMRINERGAPWQIVSCLSNRRVHPNNSFIAWTNPKGQGRVTASASLICMTWKQGKSFTIWQHIWHITMVFGYTNTLQLKMYNWLKHVTGTRNRNP